MNWDDGYDPTADQLATLAGLSPEERRTTLAELHEGGWIEHDGHADPIQRRYRTRTHRWTMQLAIALGYRRDPKLDSTWTSDG